MNLVIDITPISSLPITGIGKLLINLIEEFKKREDLKLTYFALATRGHIPKFRKKYHNLKIFPVLSRFYWKSMHLLQSIKFPLDLLTREADAVLSIAWMCLPLKSGATIAVVADTTPYTNPEWHKQSNVTLFKDRMKSIEKNADVVLAISNETKKELIKQTSISKNTIIVSYPGISKDFISKPNKKSRRIIQEKYKLPNNYLLFVGTQEPRKNLQRLIDAYSQVKHTSINLVFIGTKGWGEKVNIPSNTFNLGYIPDKDVPSIYSSAKGLLLPSIKEGFGIPIIEAFSMETPVLTSNTSAMAEIAKGAAILVDPYSVEDIARGLQELITLSEEKKAKMIKAGKKRLKKYSYEKMADTIIKKIKKRQ